MSIPSMPVEKYEAIYREIEDHDDLKGDIQRHIEERGCYLCMLEGALSSLPEGSCVLELGCGTADCTMFSAKHPRFAFRIRAATFTPGSSDSTMKCVRMAVHPDSTVLFSTEPLKK